MTQMQLDFDQKTNLQRVKSKTSGAILQFFDTLEVGQEFHAQELRDYVAALVPVAPASPDRILRDMRQRGDPASGSVEGIARYGLYRSQATRRRWVV
mgnify:CR=1 FL=1